MEWQTFNDSRKQLQAYWLSAQTLAWNLAEFQPEVQFWLYAGNLRFENNRLRAEHAYPLQPSGPVHELPYLAHFTRLENQELGAVASQILREDLVLAAQHPDGNLIRVTGIQTFSVLDQIAFYGGDDLGVTFNGQKIPTLKLWAPTARSVKLHLFQNTSPNNTPIFDRVLEMNLGTQGVWSITGEEDWNRRFYLYEVDVFVPYANEYRQYMTTDPYSRSLSMNSRHSQIVDINDPDLKPEDWDSTVKPGLDHPEDMVLYELHVRDFSISDQTVRPEYQGRFMAFTEEGSLGIQHLNELAQAGLTHIHLLPVADFATVNDDTQQRREPQIPAGLPSDSAEQQAILGEVRNYDSFNWGYDPLHYFAPEGSYSTAPHGPERTLEYREAILGLSRIGLRVVMDVVYNHTYRVTDDDPKPLEKLVPAYYYRFDTNGNFSYTACGKSGDVATEHRMMEKLMVDSLLMWARDYKVDGFRFDLMGFHTKSNLKKVREALDQLTREKDGVDGKNIYLYGEGWRFGSLNDLLPTESCCQLNLYGMGIGTFNDRLRDRVRGGDASTATRADQGFVTGLYYDDNENPRRVKTPWEREHQRLQLLHYTDEIRLSMAGNLRSYSFKTQTGKVVSGGELDHNGQPAGYAASPSETINYISAHDNYELWDQIAAKAPYYKPGRNPTTATIDQRVRMHKLGLGVVLLSQGIPFFHAGSDFLRSKSGDGNSYNSGDWFNRLDFSLTNNNWGVGLPPAWDNKNEWDFWAPRLRNPYFKPTPADMRETHEYFKGLLRVRKSSPLFRLTSAEEIQKRVHFLETDLGPAQPPGLIVMALRDDLEGLETLDKERLLIVAAINVTLHPIEFAHDLLKGRRLQRHRDWHDSFESRVFVARFDMSQGKIMVPPQTIIVFEQARPNPKRFAPAKI